MNYELLNSDQTVTAKYCRQQFICLNNALEQNKSSTDSGNRQVILQHDNV